MDFKIYFNKRRQWLDVTLWDVHPTTFARWGSGRWAYFLATWDNPKQGEFGELHMVKSGIRVDTLVHEIIHVLAEWTLANRDPLCPRNEERLATMCDEITRRFVRELRKSKIKL